MTDVLTAPPVPTTPPVEGARSGRPAWGRFTQLGVGAVAAVLYLANLSANGLGNPYYAAAVRSGSVSWRAFLFGSLDPGSFITVDKPPAAFWVQEIVVRIFGFSSWSLLVPDAVAGIVTAVVTYHLTRRMVLAIGDRRARIPGDDLDLTTVDSGTARTAEVAAVLAGLAMAFTPIALVMFRFNDPDALLTCFLALAAWAGWVALERGSIRHLVLAGVLIGFGFDAKMLVAAVVVPGLALVWVICAPTTLRRRLLGWLAGGVAMLVSAGWWVALVSLWPSSDRPYIGSTTDNSLISLIFGYNGLSRIFGNHGGGGVRAGGSVARHAADVTRGGAGGFGGAFGGQAGWGRLFGSSLGTQIGWLIPLAAVGLVAGLVVAGRARRTDRWRAAFLLMGLWAATGFVVFSKMSGTFHGYYTVAIAPPLAFLAAAGSIALWQLGRRRVLAWLLPAAVIGSGIWAYVLLDRDASFVPWARVLVLAASIVGGLLLLVARLQLWRKGRTGLIAAATLAAALGVGLGPAAYAVDSVSHGSNGTNPTAGPSGAAGGFGGAITPQRISALTGGSSARSSAIAERLGAAVGGGGRGAAGAFGSSSGPTAADERFVSYLEAHRDGAKYLVAVDGSMSADNLIIASGKPVMAMGGFSGSDPAPTLAQFEHLVSTGQVRYVLVSATRGFGGGGAGGAFGGRAGGGFGGGFGGFAEGGFAGAAGGTGTRAGGAGAAGFGGFGRSGTVQSVLSWVEAHGTEVPASAYGSSATGTLYEVTPADVR